MKNLIYSLLIFLFSAISVNGQTFNNYYGNVVAECSFDSVSRYLTEFENHGVKEPGTTALLNTFNWLIDNYTNYGYTDIVIDTFTYSGFEVYNLIVTKTGSVYPNRYYVMDGHYDSKTGTGTNDNGTGTAIILETARLLKDIPTEFSVKFIHFSMEEVGLRGSTHYVNNVALPSNLDIKLLMNIDEVGGISGMTNDIIVCERDESSPTEANVQSAAYTDSLATCVELYSTLQSEISYAYSSDYMPFQAQNYVITGLFEKNYSPHAHTANDNLANLDINYVFEIAKATVGASLYFAVALPTNITELKALNLNVYPNPASSVIYIEGVNENSNYSYQLINQLGQISASGSLNKKINTAGIPNSVYQLLISNGSIIANKTVVIR